MFSLQDESNVSVSTSNTNSCSPKYHPFPLTDAIMKSPAYSKGLLSIRDTGLLQQCPECKKYFKRLENHITTHHLKEFPEKPYSCGFCNKLFKSLSNLSVHTRTHTGLRPYVCQVCNKGFTQSGNLVHHSRIHTNTRPYKCPVCERAFTQPGNLSNHMRLHSQEKPFRCHLCDRAFTQSSNLTSHLKNNHKELQYDIINK